MHVGDRVRLKDTGNAVLEGAVGVVLELADYGALLDLPAAATGRYRAGFWELVPLEPDRNGHAAEAAVASGYTGDACDSCGSLAMRRSGACLVCDACGKSGGCG
jgi:hypothetical protein